MELRQIGRAELEIGQALQWDVYGEGGSLLARKGYQIESDVQIDHLIERGKVAVPRPELPSVVRMLNKASGQMQALLGEISAGAARDGRARLEETAQLIIRAVELHPEVAQACILHNQDAAPYAVRHSMDTAIVAMLVARALKKGLSEVLTVTLGAMTMNVGMLRQQERMQSTRGALAESDMLLIRDHPEASAALLRRAGVADPELIACVLLHHENEDGSGYPFGKCADEIPPLAKILSLADRYCARVSARNYRKSMLPNRALGDILLEERATIDPQLAAAFLHQLGTYPIGTVVRLRNEETAVVTGRGTSTTTPVVDVIRDPRGARPGHQVRRDTSQYACHEIAEVLPVEQAGPGFALAQLWGPVASA